MNFGTQRTVWRILPAAIVALAFVGDVRAQQFPPAGNAGSAASTNLLQPVQKTWKDNMLERQLRSGTMKSFDFAPNSLNGVAVNPAASSRDNESSSTKRRREQMEQMKFLMLLNADDPSKDTSLDDLMSMQGREADAAITGTPLEQLYLKQLQKERSAATNRARAELNFRNDSNPALVSGSENRGDSAGANSFLKNSTDPNRTSPGTTPLFPDLFNPPASSPNQARLQQAHANEFRQMLNVRSPGASSLDSGRSPSSLGKTINSFSAPASSALNPGASPVVSTPVFPAYQAPQQPKTPPSTYSPPKRKF